MQPQSQEIEFNEGKSMKTYEFAYGRSSKKFKIDEELVIK